MSNNDLSKWDQYIVKDEAPVDKLPYNEWYAGHAERLGLDPNPNAKEHYYNYEAAYNAGASPDPEKDDHWPSEFKLEGHPNEIVNGWNTRLNRKATPEEMKRNNIEPESNKNDLSKWDQYIVRDELNPERDFIDALAESKPVRAINKIGNEYLQPFEFGAIEGLGAGLASAGNLASEKIFNSDKRFEKPDLSPYLHEDATGLGSQLAGGAGNLVGNLALPVGIYGQAAKLPQLAGKLGLLQQALAGGGAEYLTGEFNPGGREASAAVGAVAPVAIAALPKSVADKVLKARDTVKEQYSKAYGHLFKSAQTAIEHAGKKIKPPDMRIETLMKGMTRDEKSMMNRFIKDPNLENAHWAQSEIGAFERRMEALREKRGGSLPNSKVPQVDEAKMARMKLRGYIHQNLSLANPKLSNEYANLSKGYGKDVIPYFDPKLGLEKYSKGKLSPSDTVKALQGNYEFKTGIGKFHPEVQLNKAFKYGLVGAGAYGGANYLPDFLLKKARLGSDE